MTLKEKIAIYLWEQDDEDSWDTWNGLEPYRREPYLDRADNILNLMQTHLGIR